MARQLPNKKGASTIRVLMDPDEMQKLLSPILDEVNSLRRRVAELETRADNADSDIVILSKSIDLIVGDGK